MTCDVQTSDSRPLSISWIVRGSITDRGSSSSARVSVGNMPVELPPGSLGLCFCPGQQQKRGNHSRLERDMAADLGRLASHFGVTTIVNLLSDMELRVGGHACMQVQAGAGHACGGTPNADATGPH